MSERISFGYTVCAMDGPALGSSQDLPATGYEKLSVSLAPSESKTLAVLPSGAHANLVVVESSPGDTAITYDSGDGAKALEAPLVLIGADAASLLGSSFPSLTLHNGTGTGATISIFVGRSD